ncbi:MAG: NADH-quinone oxidoreductase subunit C [Acidobacteria bacterium]|nr:NADH-quinone oxidoreductase subunit C [Acidobacteriota bacterium]
MADDTNQTSEKPTPPAVRPRPKPAAGVAGRKPRPKAPPEPPKGPPDPAPPEGMEPPAYVAALQAGVAGAVSQVTYWVGDWSVIVPADRLLEVARFLRDDPGCGFDYCADVTATDWPPREQRFDVIYCLYSTLNRHRLRVKVRAAEGDPVPSVTGIWPAANWLEREVYDQFGVNIVDHPDLRRILMPDEWQGHPQRKDYPLEGPGEFLMEDPLDWLRVWKLPEEAESEIE